MLMEILPKPLSEIPVQPHNRGGQREGQGDLVPLCGDAVEKPTVGERWDLAGVTVLPFCSSQGCSPAGPALL